MLIFLVGQGPTDLYLEPSLIDLGETPVDLVDRVRLSINGLLFTVGAFDPALLPGLAWARSYRRARPSTASPSPAGSSPSTSAAPSASRQEVRRRSGCSPSSWRTPHCSILR